MLVKYIFDAVLMVHAGMQHDVIYAGSRYGLPLTETILPEHLTNLGYENHIVGKWHLGSFKKTYTPLQRGFKSHYGYWMGHQDYFDHTHNAGVNLSKLVEP